MNLSEGIPFDRTRLEGIEDDVPPAAIVEAGEITAVRISNDSAITALQGTSQQFGDGGGLARPRGANEFKMLGFVCCTDGHTGKMQRLIVAPEFNVVDWAPGTPPSHDQSSAFVPFHGINTL
jgi:hypothetical protein